MATSRHLRLKGTTESEEQDPELPDTVVMGWWGWWCYSGVAGEAPATPSLPTPMPHAPGHMPGKNHPWGRAMPALPMRSDPAVCQMWKREGEGAQLRSASHSACTAVDSQVDSKQLSEWGSAPS